MEYKNLSNIVIHNDYAEFDAKMAFSFEYFINNFWIAIRNYEIKQKLVCCSNGQNHLSLWYNHLAFEDGREDLSKEEIQEKNEDCKETILYALHRIDECIGGKVPFIEKSHPILNVSNGEIALNGRLPMEPAIFLKKYWKPLTKVYYKSYQWVHFELFIVDSGTTMRIKVEENKKKKPTINWDTTTLEQQLTNDVADQILEAAINYEKACRH